MIRIPTTFIAVLLIALPTYGQSASAEEEAVKAALRQETQHALDLDLEGVLAGWVHDDKTTRTVISASGYDQLTGWDAIADWYTEAAKRYSEPVKRGIRNSNYIVRVDGSTAWAEYDQEMIDEQGNVTNRTREQRLLKKQGGRWKIAAMTIIVR